MIHYIIKNARYKYILAAGALVIIFLTLVKMEGMEHADAFRVIFGGIPLDRPIKIFAFIMNMSLIQFINADVILLLIKRNAYLIIRCEKRGTLLLRLLISIIVSDLLMVILAVSSFELVMLLIHGNVVEFRQGILIEIGIRGWFTCILISLLQIISLLKLDEMYSFLVMLGVSVIFAFLSYQNSGIFSPFPVELEEGWKLLGNSLICIIYIVGIMVIAYILYRKKDVSAYDD